MTESTSGPHALSLKIMRLSGPSFVAAPNIPVLNCPLEEWSSWSRQQSLHPISPVDFSDYMMTELLLLPVSFGNIYLGETFSCFVAVNNESAQKIVDVSVKAELQTTSQRFALSDSNSHSLDSMNPNQSHEFVLDHEIKELGIHILVCSVHYSVLVDSYSKEKESKFFRKFYKFQVLNPFSVKTKVNSLSDGRVYLETQIQNVMTVPMHIERIRFDPFELFHFVDLNQQGLEYGKNVKDFVFTNSSKEELNVNSKSKSSITMHIFKSYLIPQDTRQYLYLLVPKKDVEFTILKTTPSLGKLDITWSTQLGSTGRLQTSQLQRKIPSMDAFELSVLSQPSEIQVETPFKVHCRLKNNLASDPLRLVLAFDLSKMTHVMAIGSLECQFGQLQGQEQVEFDLEFLALYPGLHRIPGISVTESLSGVSKNVDSLTDVFVLSC